MANCTPPHRSNPFAMTSIRRSSWRDKCCTSSLPTFFCVQFALKSKFPPRCLPEQLPAFMLFQYPRCPTAISCIHLVLHVVPPWPPLCVSTISRTHAVSISKSPPRLSTVSCMHRHLGSISRFLIFPSPTCLSLTNFLRQSGLNIYMSPRFFQHLLACILFRYLNAPILCLSAVSGHSFFCSKTFPCVSQYFSCMYLHVPSIGFNVYASPLISTIFCVHPVSTSFFPFPLCPSIFCIPFVSYVGFLIGLSTTSYVFVVSISEPPLHQQLLARIMSPYLHSSHLCQVQKACTSSTKKGAKA